MAEMWVDHIARTLGQPPEAVRALNFYREGDSTHFGQVLEGCQVGPVLVPACCYCCKSLRVQQLTRQLLLWGTKGRIMMVHC